MSHRHLSIQTLLQAGGFNMKLNDHWCTLSIDNHFSVQYNLAYRDLIHTFFWAVKTAFMKFMYCSELSSVPLITCKIHTECIFTFCLHYKWTFKNGKIALRVLPVCRSISKCIEDDLTTTFVCIYSSLVGSEKDTHQNLSVHFLTHRQTDRQILFLFVDIWEERAQETGSEILRDNK